MMTGAAAGGDPELTGAQNVHGQLLRKHSGRSEAAGAVPGKAGSL
jgi:hypothetical protein